MRKHRGLRRVAALGLVLSMLFGMSVTSMAADPQKQVVGHYKGGGDKIVYSYNYSFGDLEFDYVGGTKGIWNPSTHSYQGESKGGGWFGNSGTGNIEVRNHSNAPIRVTMNFESALPGIKFGFTKPSFVLNSAEGTSPIFYAEDDGTRGTTTVGPASDCRALTEEEGNVVLGTVTIHVSGVE